MDADNELLRKYIKINEMQISTLISRVGNLDRKVKSLEKVLRRVNQNEIKKIIF